MNNYILHKCFSNKYLIHLRTLQSIRFYSQDFKKPAPKNFALTPDPDDEKDALYQRKTFGDITVKTWNERAAVRKAIKQSKPPLVPDNWPSLVRSLQSLNDFPITLTDWYYFLKGKQFRMELADQQFLPSRVQVLKHDLAAAHFIVARGGAIKFVGKPDWIKLKDSVKLLPEVYIPGLFVEGINAENTKLIYEGLPNIAQLKYLTYLSLKNLDTMDDWCLDWISSEYFLTLKHLDISGCKNITHRGLSCFYRFECLETLNVTGVSETPEFKLACLMLLDIMPNLDIKGIDLSVPKEIYPLKTEKIHNPS